MLLNKHKNSHPHNDRHSGVMEWGLIEAKYSNYTISLFFTYITSCSIIDFDLILHVCLQGERVYSILERNKHQFKWWMLWYVIRFQIYFLMIDRRAKMPWNSVFYIEIYWILQDLSHVCTCRREMLPNDLALLFFFVFCFSWKRFMLYIHLKHADLVFTNNYVTQCVYM